MVTLFNSLYRILSSLKTSVYLLGLLAVFYLLGTVFPQGVEFEKYKEAGGRYLLPVKLLGLLNVFSSPVFLFLSVLLLANISVCIYSRIKAYMRSSLRVPDSQIKANADLTVEAAHEKELVDYLHQRGLRIIYEDETQRVFQRGIPNWWTSWAFHIGMAIAILGFFITFLSAHESELTLYPDKPVEFSLYSPETRWNRFLGFLGFSVPEKVPEKTYKITLKEFRTTYQEKLSLEYPKRVPERMAIGLGLAELKTAPEPEPYPLQYETSFVIQFPDNKKEEATLRVNHPYRRGSLTLYQMGYDQKITLQVGRETIEVEPYKPFEVEGLEGRFVLYGIKWGKMTMRDGSEKDLIPQAYLYRINKSKREKLGLLKKGQWNEIEGKRWTIKDFQEASVLSYRVDRGLPLAGVGTTVAMIAVFLRAFGGFRRVRLLRQEDKIYLSIYTSGVFNGAQTFVSEFISKQF